VCLAVGIDRSADPGYPKLDVVVAEHWEDELELGTGKGPLWFPDDETSPSAKRIGCIGEEACGFRSP
jgi:hypothetical protein